jgi:hypothetical protein
MRQNIRRMDTDTQVRGGPQNCDEGPSPSYFAAGSQIEFTANAVQPVRINGALVIIPFYLVIVWIISNVLGIISFR